MATAENISIVRRVDELEAQVRQLQLVYVRTTIVVLGRQEEPEYLTVDEVLAAAEHEPEPVELRRVPDLEALIDPVNRTRRLRHQLSPEGQAAFDDIKSRARLVDLPITCHEKQLSAILSNKLTTAAIGGNQAGKSFFLVFWFFRRWLMRGGQGHRFFWQADSIDKLFAQGIYCIAGQLAQGGGVWPDELMRLPEKGIPTGSKKLRIDMIDGSVVEFKHGSGDGGNVKSATVWDYVIDELGEVKKIGNYKQACVRVMKTGGRVAVATTRVRGHWLEDEIFKKAAVSPQTTHLCEFDLFDSPFLTLARIYALFLNDSTLTVKQLEDVVLPAADKRSACLSVIKDPRSLREHFGIEVQGSRLMWPNWSDEFIYNSNERRHAELFVSRDGEAVRLVNITEAVLGTLWVKANREGRRFSRWVGVDANVRGHAVVLELFGEGRSVAEAVANVNTWTVLVVDEIQVDGTTQQLGEQIKKQVGLAPIFIDPTAAMTGHVSRGSGDTNDAAVLRRMGFDVQPANGARQDGKVNHLEQVPSRDAMSQLMAEGRLRVHERCVGFIEAMHKDVARPDGKIDKRSGVSSESDFLSGFSDAGRYGMWPLLRKMGKANPIKPDRGEG
jgi:hypothetical protein